MRGGVEPEDVTASYCWEHTAVPLYLIILTQIPLATHKLGGNALKHMHIHANSVIFKGTQRRRGRGDNSPNELAWVGDPVAWREEWCRHGDTEAKGLSHGVMQVCFEGDENTLILLLYAKPHIGTVGTVAHTQTYFCSSHFTRPQHGFCALSKRPFFCPTGPPMTRSGVWGV